MENSWKQILNLKEFDRYYSKQDARKLIVFIKMLHESFDAIVDSRARVGTFEGCTDIGLIYNTNLENMLKNYGDINNPTTQSLTCGQVTNLCLINGRQGLLGWLPIDKGQGKMGQLCQIVSPTDTFRRNAITVAFGDKAAEAYDDAVSFFDDQDAGWRKSKVGKLFRENLAQKNITIDANQWMADKTLVDTVWDPTAHPIVVQQLTNNINNRAGNPLQFYSGREYHLSRDNLADFLLIPTNNAIIEAGEIVSESLVSYRPQGSSASSLTFDNGMKPTFYYDIEQANAPLNIADWKPLAQTVLRALDEGGAYKTYGNQTNQLSVSSVIDEINPTPFIVGNGQCCAVCSKIIAKKKKTSPDPGNWKDEPCRATASQSYDVDHILNLIFNTLLGLNSKGLGFLNTCGPCNRKFKGEKIWSPNYNLWQTLIDIAEFTGEDSEDILEWPGKSLPGIAASKPFGGYRSYITGGETTPPPGMRDVNLYESGCGMTSESAKINRGEIQMHSLELQNVILDRLLQCMNEGSEVLIKIMSEWQPLNVDVCDFADVAEILREGISVFRQSYAERVSIFPYMHQELRYVRALNNTARSRNSGYESQGKANASQNVDEAFMGELGGSPKQYRKMGTNAAAMAERAQQIKIQQYAHTGLYLSPDSNKEKTIKTGTPARGHGPTGLDFRKVPEANTRLNLLDWLLPIVELVSINETNGVVYVKNITEFNRLIRDEVGKTTLATAQQLQQNNQNHLYYMSQIISSLQKRSQDVPKKDFENYKILSRKGYVINELTRRIQNQCEQTPNPLFMYAANGDGASSSSSSIKCKPSKAVAVASVQQQQKETERNIEAVAQNLYGQLLPSRGDPKSAVSPPENVVMNEIVEIIKRGGVNGIHLTQLFKNLKHKNKKIKGRSAVNVIHKAVNRGYLNQNASKYLKINTQKINAANPWKPGRKLLGGKRTRKKRRKKKTRRKRKYRKKTKGRKRRRKKRTRRKR